MGGKAEGMIMQLSHRELHDHKKEPSIHFIGGQQTIGFNKKINIMHFDNFKEIEQKKVIHIDKITFLFQDYIVGFIIDYNIDGARVTSKVIGNTHHYHGHPVPFKELEHIIELSVSYCKKGINSITGKTNLEQKFSVEGFKGYGT